jgi:hypothetical protein
MADENTQEPTRLAKDGTRRGVAKTGSKNRATQLLEQMQEQIEAKYGLKNFDPVVMLAMIGVEASEPRPVLDHKGRQVYITKTVDGIEIPVLDDEGEMIPMMTTPDMNLATNALGKAAPYVRSTLKQIEVTDGEDGPIDADVMGARERFRAIRAAALAAEAAEPEEDDA